MFVIHGSLVVHKRVMLIDQGRVKQIDKSV